MLFALALVLSVGVGPSRVTDAPKVIEGNLEVLIEDSSGGSRTLYFLITEDARIPLRFVTAPRNLRTGTRVRVHGDYEPDGRFVVVSLERVAPSG